MLTRMALLAVLMFVASCSVPTAGQSTAPTASGWSVSPTPSVARPTSEFDADQVLEVIRKEGFTVFSPEVPETGPLRAFDGLCTGSVNGRCHRVFIYDGPTRVGAIDAGIVEIINQSGKEVILQFPQYKVGDAGCCPSGEQRKHTGRMVDGKLTFTPPIPADPNNPETR